MKMIKEILWWNDSHSSKWNNCANRNFLNSQLRTKTKERREWRRRRMTEEEGIPINNIKHRMRTWKIFNLRIERSTLYILISTYNIIISPCSPFSRFKDWNVRRFCGSILSIHSSIVFSLKPQKFYFY